MNMKIETTELDKLLLNEDFQHLSELINPPSQDGEDLLEIADEAPEEE